LFEAYNPTHPLAENQSTKLKAETNNHYVELSSEKKSLQGNRNRKKPG
jgi:hypothetical protein